MAVDYPESPHLGAHGRIRTSLQGTVGTRHNRLIRSQMVGWVEEPRERLRKFFFY